jgi:hypothetical protein
MIIVLNEGIYSFYFRIISIGFFLSFAKEAMLNINAFFEFKQRKRHTHSFQLAQLIYHSQHLNDYYTLSVNLNTYTNKKKSTTTGSDDPVSILFRNKNKFLKIFHFQYHIEYQT